MLFLLLNQEKFRDRMALRLLSVAWFPMLWMLPQRDRLQ